MVGLCSGESGDAYAMQLVPGCDTQGGWWHTCADDHEVEGFHGGGFELPVEVLGEGRWVFASKAVP